MKLNNLLFISISLLITYNSFSDTIITADNPLIEYTGRIDFSDPLSPEFSYSGVSIRACFEGTSISMKLNDENNQNYFDIILDKSVISRIQTKKGLNTYLLAESLKDTIHEIEVFRLTELIFGKTKFCGFMLDNIKTLVPISSIRSHFIEFIGNSITCGYGNEGAFGQEAFGPATENHYLTYAAITSRSLDAKHLAVCKSGIGIYRNYGGPEEGSPDCMPNYYQRIFLYDENPKYNFAAKPDLTCIDLGTNDFSTSGGDSAKFVSNYLQFIDTIQAKNKGADILCLLGSMLDGNDLNRVRRYIKDIVDLADSNKKGNVYFFEMSEQKGDLGIGIDDHPNVAQHLKNAKELTKYIASLKGWPVHPRLIYCKVINPNEIELYFNTELVDSFQNFTGFSITANSSLLSISNAYPDIKDKSVLHLTLKESFDPGQDLFLSYTPGSITSTDDIKLDRILPMNINYNLTAVSVNYIETHDIFIYPDPSFTKKLNYRFSQNSSEKIRVKLYDMQGKMIVINNLTYPEGILDYSAYNTSAGNYILKLKTPYLRLSENDNPVKDLLIDWLIY